MLKVVVVFRIFYDIIINIMISVIIKAKLRGSLFLLIITSNLTIRQSILDIIMKDYLLV